MAKKNLAALEVKVMAALNGNNVEIEEMDKFSSVRIPIEKAVKLVSRLPLYGIDKTYSGYGYEKIKKLIPYSSQLTASMFDGNGLTTLNFINTIISKEMNHVIDDAAFGRPVKLGTIARLNRLVSKRARIISNIGHYFGINTLNANEVYAVDTNGIYRHPLAEIAYERLFK